MKRAHQTSAGIVPARSERRRMGRIVPPDHIQCALAGNAVRLEPKDVSATGIAVWCKAALAVGRDYDLIITLDEFTLPRRARVVHCRRDHDGRWLIGLRFLENDGKIDELIRLIATEFRPE